MQNSQRDKRVDSKSHLKIIKPLGMRISTPYLVLNTEVDLENGSRVQYFNFQSGFNINGKKIDYLCYLDEKGIFREADSFKRGIGFVKRFDKEKNDYVKTDLVTLVDSEGEQRDFTSRGLIESQLIACYDRYIKSLRLREEDRNLIYLGFVYDQNLSSYTDYQNKEVELLGEDFILGRKVQARAISPPLDLDLRAIEIKSRYRSSFGSNGNFNGDRRDGK